MSAEAKRNTPLTIAAAFVTMILVSLLGYSFSGVHKEAAPAVDTATAAPAKQDASAKEAAAPDKDEQAADSKEAPADAGADSKEAADEEKPASEPEPDEDAGGSDSGGAAPGYGQ